MKLSVWLIFLCGCLYNGFGQQEAWVYFTDKANVEASIQNPISILTQPALDRRAAQGISIDARDVPVNESYVNNLKNRSGITVMAKSKWMNAVHVRGEISNLSALESIDFVASVVFVDKALNQHPRPVVVKDKFAIETTTEDFNYGQAQNQLSMVHVDALHLASYTGEGVVIAVLDAGFPKVNSMASLSRLRDNNKLLGGYDFVDRTSGYDISGSSAHGTRVLSVMAGYIEDEFVGTAPNASYYLFRTEDVTSENPVEESYWVEAAERADSLGVHIINSSLGYTDFDNPKYNYMVSDMDGTRAFISRGAQIAAEKGILVVNSAGNSGNTTWETVMAPADAPGVLSVGAVNGQGVYAPFSSIGNAAQPTLKPDVVAQGLATVVINENDEVMAVNGTSFSAPIVAGAIACLWEAMPSASAEDIKQAVRLSSSQYTAPDHYLGYGIPNFQLALSLGLSVKSNDVAWGFKIYPNPVANHLYVQVPKTNEKKVLRVYSLLGEKLIEQTVLTETPIIEVTQLAKGMYVLSLSTGSIHYNYKFIKS